MPIVLLMSRLNRFGCRTCRHCAQYLCLKSHGELQNVGKKHGLDDLDKIKEQGVLEQVII